MKIRTTFPHTVTEHPHTLITLPDGTRLSARIWRPDTETPVPVILEHLPYRHRDGTVVRDTFSHPWMTGHGYAVIRTDMRGSGESEGRMDDEYTQQEWDDACAVIEWVAAQPWCNGRAGMQGISWGGFNCLQVAALRPPALKAVISICSTVDRFADDIHYKGGCLLVENFGWAANMLSYSSRPPDAALFEGDWKSEWLARLDDQPFHWKTWHEHQHRDAYWKHGSICEDYSAVTAAVLSVGGWHDGYRNAPFHIAANVPGAKAIIGPWNHKYPHYARPEPAIGFLQESKRWWDRWLKDEPTGVEDDPTLRLYEMDSVTPARKLDHRPGRWITLDRADDCAITTLHLAYGRLASSPEPADATVASPQTHGLGAGEYFPFAMAEELPDEQSADDARATTFDGEAVTEATRIVGAPTVHLRLACDRPAGLIAIRLTDLRPDGTSALITHGVLNLAHARSHEAPEPIVPGEPFDITFALDHIAYRLPAGHRLRLAVANASWPTVWPSPEATVLTIHKGRLDLPLYESDEGWAFEEPEGAAPWQAHERRGTSYSRETTTDPDTGIVTITIICDNGENEDADHGLISGSRFMETFHIHPDDPTSARATADWEQTGGRKGNMWRTRARAEMTCDAAHFYATATLEAWLEGERVFMREWDESVPRDLV